MSLILSLLALLPCILYAAVIPMTLDGALDSATADSTAYNTGGKITVNGVSIVIPKNLQFQFPAAWVPFKAVAASDFTGNEVTVFGNYVDGVAIAGIVQLSQFALEANTGTIESLAFDGTIKMTGGQTVRINDPNAVYSAGYTANPLFTADDVNPSITAYSGFPMCVPRSANDAKCPGSNRPAGQNTFTAPDSLTMAPFLPGDFIEFKGIRSGSEILAISMVATSVQILTTGMPPYIRVEDAIIGVFDGQPLTAVEFAESRFIGFTSDASASITITRSEVDPCTGNVTDVPVGAATPVPAGAGAPPRNRFRWRSDSTTQVKYAREYKASASTGTKATNGGQITAGVYNAPVGDWIFPELGPGGTPSKNDFSQFTFLRDGLGPDTAGNVWDTTTPSPFTPTCAPPTPSGSPPPVGTTATPVANAGPDIILRQGIVAHLVGKADNAASFQTGDLTFAWTQTGGPTITLSGTASPSAAFTAPAVATLTTYTFSCKVSSTGFATSSTDTIIVTNDPNGKDEVIIDSYTWSSGNGGTISAIAHSNVVDGSAKLSLVLNNPGAGAPIPMTSTGGGKFSYSARSTKKPSNGITVQSQFGGSTSTTTTTAKRRSRIVQAVPLVK
ncbi:hypothetical protein LTR17_009156 [Elasticomyces elasticus]|nr:hypothetical protein LTR17_009156 [Elasticomyces elasticus]